MILGGCALAPHRSEVPTWPQALERLLPTEILLLGERHDAPQHQDMQRQTVQWLAQRGLLAALVMAGAEPRTWIVVGGLAMFGIAFAINSSVHIYLVLAYAGSEKAAEDVGFYYAANALGRFLGTLMSGLLYQHFGLVGALSGSAVMLVLCWLVTLGLPARRQLSAATAAR